MTFRYCGRGRCRTLIDACAGDEVGVLTVEMNDPHGYGRIVREGGKVVRNVEERDASSAEKSNHGN